MSVWCGRPAGTVPSAYTMLLGGEHWEQSEVCPPEFSLGFPGVFRLGSDISLRPETGAKVLGWLSLLLRASYLENENLALKRF